MNVITAPRTKVTMGMAAVSPSMMNTMSAMVVTDLLAEVEVEVEVISMTSTTNMTIPARALASTVTDTKGMEAGRISPGSK